MITFSVKSLAYVFTFVMILLRLVHVLVGHKSRFLASSYCERLLILKVTRVVPLETLLYMEDVSSEFCFTEFPNTPK